ncbi:3-hydroxyacyl-CoA dehydrogenase NAD-binding domain-containing protein [Dyella sp. KRB-257]|uniref:3-hydroxyacyl-CoA dehydrogenase NAD-binding domain-containing protein n=1 Tax=Dyella sp. KRB-257 TaxID=3400915 RepID=UPI003C0CF6C3
MNKPLVILEVREDVALVCIDNPPVNALSRGVREGLVKALRQAAADSRVSAVVLYCAGRTFVAGADIAEFDSGQPSTEDIHELFGLLDGYARPVVAALHGTALGGGLELALVSHFRVASRSAKVGLPEVHLGLLPGAGGTQRLPRLIGAKAALELILSGKQVAADQALALGIVDEVVDGDLLDAAIVFAHRVIEEHRPQRRASALPVNPASVPAGLFEQARQTLAQQRSGNPAPVRIIACVEAAVTQPFTQGLATEQRLFGECLHSPASAALRHRFFAEREVSKIPGLSGNLTPRSISRVGVVGAGTMGGGIAMNFANIGMPVVIVETTQAALDRSLGIVRKNYEAAVAKGRLSPAQLDQRMSLLRGALDYPELAECDLVIEAVFEDLALKKQVCARLGQVCRPGAIIASNTSSLDVDALAQASGRPADVLGMHFFSPAHVMRLLEVVRGAHTGTDVLSTVVKLARTIGKVPVVSGVCYGFIGNRMAECYLREAEQLLLEGATAQQVDAAVESLGLPMGPFRMLDLAGVDVVAKVVIERGKSGQLLAGPTYRAVALKLMELGRYGQKTGSGFYRYEGRTPLPDPAIEQICAALAARHGIIRRHDIAEQEIIERCFYPLINEGAKVLEEGIAYRPGDIDVVWINGYSFPDYLGGPMFWADQLGLSTIAARMDHYAAQLGNEHGYWSQAALLKRLAAAGRGFASLTESELGGATG